MPERSAGDLRSPINVTVLLIEDNEADVDAISTYLSRSSDPSFTLHHAMTLDEGLKHLQEHLVDIIVLDLSLPDSSGLDTLFAIRPAAMGIPIVILSGIADEQISLEAVRRGAQDFLTKREAISASLGHSLQNAIERFHRQRAEREIETAALVQQRLYPKPLTQLTTLDVTGRCVAANQVGGDYFDYFMPDAQSLILVIGDVSGHGFGPSLVMAETHAALRTMATTTNDIGVMIHQVNEMLFDEDLGKFVSLFLARIEVTTGVCRYAAAGHPALLIRADGSTETLETRDPPLGVRGGALFEVRETQLHLNDRVLLYTDGLSERASANSELFGVERLRALMATCGGLTASESVDCLFAEANRFAAGRPPVDDMTAIILRVVSPF